MPSHQAFPYVLCILINVFTCTVFLLVDAKVSYHSHLLVYTGHECDVALNLYHSIAIQLMITHQAVYISITICITLMLCF